MLCAKCGYAMTDFDMECPRCVRMANSGGEMVTPIMPAVRSATQAQVDQRSVRVEVVNTARPSTWALHIVACLLPLVGFIISAIYLSNTNRNTQIAGQEVIVSSLFSSIFIGLNIYTMVIAFSKRPSPIGAVFFIGCCLLAIWVVAIINIRKKYDE